MENESTRQSKVSRLIQREMGDIFQKENILSGVMISVTQVRTTTDLGVAKIFISLFPSNNKKEDLEAVKKRAQDLRYILGKRVSKQLRHIPELHFYLDDSFDYAEEIDNLLKD